MNKSGLRQPIPVGRYFVEQGKLTPQQLELALSHREEFGLKLGQSLVELGLVTEAEMVEALRHQARFPCIHLTPGIVDPRIAAKVGEPESLRLRALAMNQVAGHTTVAMEDPSDEEAIADLQHVLATRILPVYAEPSVIRRCQERIFGAKKRARQGAGAEENQTAKPAAASAPARASDQAPAQEQRAQEIAASSESTGEFAGGDERAVVGKVRSLLHRAFEQGARSIHLEARADGLVVRLRCAGELREYERFPAGWRAPTIACLKSLAKIDLSLEGPQTGRLPLLFKKRPIEVRVSTTPSLHGESAVLHVQSAESGRDLGQLGLFPEQVAQLEALLAGPPGLFVVTGAVHSGRRTTYRALQARLAGLATGKKIVVLHARGEPELQDALHVCLSSGVDPSQGIHACLQQDPDLLCVQEGGQREVAHNLLTAALGGACVLTTLRAGRALRALGGLQALGLEPYLLAEALRVVVAQAVVRTICPDCRTPIVPDTLLAQRLQLPQDGATYFEGAGCEACHGTGVRGRLALFEVLGMTPNVRRELERGAAAETLGPAAHAEGFLDLRVQGLRYAREGHTTLHEVLRATSN